MNKLCIWQPLARPMDRMRNLVRSGFAAQSANIFVHIDLSLCAPAYRGATAKVKSVKLVPACIHR